MTLAESSELFRAFEWLRGLVFKQNHRYALAIGIRTEAVESFLKKLDAEESLKCEGTAASLLPCGRCKICELRGELKNLIRVKV